MTLLLAAFSCLSGCVSVPTGSVEMTTKVTTSPTTADIFVNAKYRGRSPVNVKLWYTHERRVNKVIAVPIYPNQSIQVVQIEAPNNPKLLSIFMNRPSEEGPFMIGEEVKEVEPVVEEVVVEKIEIPFKNIYFALNQAVIVAEEELSVQGNALWLVAHPDIKVLLTGHGDERGSSHYNFGLALERAEAVMAALLNAGVSADQLIASSRGEEDPASIGSDEEAWKHNRRVEFVLVMEESGDHAASAELELESKEREIE